jgi:hypothetical protein
MVEEIESPPGDDVTSSFDQEAFAVLFFDRLKNRRKIWVQMGEIIRHVADRHIRVRSVDDLDEMKGDALAFAMDIAMRDPATAQTDGRGAYDPNRRTAYDYFYSVVKNHMGSLVKQHQARATHLGDADSEISFHDLYGVQPQDAARMARSNCLNNWKSNRVHSARDRFVIEKYLNSSIEKADKVRRESRRTLSGTLEGGSAAELAVIAVTIETLKQIKRALLGE